MQKMLDLTEKLEDLLKYKNEKGILTFLKTYIRENPSEHILNEARLIGIFNLRVLEEDDSLIEEDPVKIIIAKNPLPFLGIIIRNFHDSKSEEGSRKKNLAIIEKLMTFFRLSGQYQEMLNSALGYYQGTYPEVLILCLENMKAIDISKRFIDMFRREKEDRLDKLVALKNHLDKENQDRKYDHHLHLLDHIFRCILVKWCEPSQNGNSYYNNSKRVIGFLDKVRLSKETKSIIMQIFPKREETKEDILLLLQKTVDGESLPLYNDLVIHLYVSSIFGAKMFLALFEREDGKELLLAQKDRLLRYEGEDIVKDPRVKAIYEELYQKYFPEIQEKGNIGIRATPLYKLGKSPFSWKGWPIYFLITMLAIGLLRSLIHYPLRDNSVRAVQLGDSQKPLPIQKIGVRKWREDSSFSGELATESTFLEGLVMVEWYEPVYFIGISFIVIAVGSILFVGFYNGYFAPSPVEPSQQKKGQENMKILSNEEKESVGAVREDQEMVARESKEAKGYHFSQSRKLLSGLIALSCTLVIYFYHSKGEESEGEVGAQV